MLNPATAAAGAAVAAMTVTRDAAEAAVATPVAAACAATWVAVVRLFMRRSRTRIPHAADEPIKFQWDKLKKNGGADQT